MCLPQLNQKFLFLQGILHLLKETELRVFLRTHAYSDNSGNLGVSVTRVCCSLLFRLFKNFFLVFKLCAKFSIGVAFLIQCPCLTFNFLC